MLSELPLEISHVMKQSHCLVHSLETDEDGREDVFGETVGPKEKPWTGFQDLQDESCQSCKIL